MLALALSHTQSSHVCYTPYSVFKRVNIYFQMSQGLSATLLDSYLRGQTAQIGL